MDSTGVLRLLLMCVCTPLRPPTPAARPCPRRASRSRRSAPRCAGRSRRASRCSWCPGSLPHPVGDPPARGHEHHVGDALGALHVAAATAAGAARSRACPRGHHTHRPPIPLLRARRRAPAAEHVETRRDVMARLAFTPPSVCGAVAGEVRPRRRRPHPHGARIHSGPCPNPSSSSHPRAVVASGMRAIGRTDDTFRVVLRRRGGARRAGGVVRDSSRSARRRRVGRIWAVRCPRAVRGAHLATTGQHVGGRLRPRRTRRTGGTMRPPGRFARQGSSPGSCATSEWCAPLAT